MSQFQRGNRIRYQTREIMNNVITFYEKEALKGAFRIPLNQAQKRCAAATGVSLSTVKMIKREFERLKDNPEGGGTLTTPGKHRQKAEHHIAYVNDMDKCIIRDVVNEYYTERQKVPTLNKLLSILREKIDFPWQKDTLRTTLLSMSYRYTRLGRKWGQKKILIENPDIAAWRNKYLRTMKKYRENQRTIVYVGEMWIENNLSFHKFWRSRLNAKPQTYLDIKNMLVVIHAGTPHGFLPNTHLIYETGAKTGDFQGPLDHQNFEKWMQEKLIPNIPKNSVIVLDNSPHHTKKADPVPSKFSIRQVMMTWLEQKNVVYDPGLRKPELHALIQQHAPKTILYRVDKIANEAGHDVIRPPPHHGNLNAIQFVWDSVEKFIKEKIAPENVSLPELQRLLWESFTEIGPKTWKEFCEHVENSEKKYWEMDGHVEDIVDEITIQMMTSKECEESSSDGSFDDFSETDTASES